MVLVVTHSRDDHAPAVLAELLARDVEVARFDTDAPTERSLARIELGDGGVTSELLVEGGWLSSERVSAVLYRHLQLPDAAHISDPQAREMASSELRATIEGALLAIDARWLNHPHANGLARQKPLQLAQAARVGFSVPETLITDDPEQIRALHRRWDGRMIAKLAGGQIAAQDAAQQYAVFTTPICEQDLRDDAALSACPAIYQRRVEKAFDLRVTVVGEQTFACRIDSQAHEDAAVDWRQAGPEALTLREDRVDEATAERCLALMRRFGLDFAAFDFAVTPDGQPVFLELNAAGRWLWVQEATGMPIAAAVAERLAQAGNSLARG